jgi:tRNA pseudouridine55 synthase
MAMERILAIYKPKGPTSNDVVQYIKRITGGEKVGHAGTLDPLAEGVLVVGIGREATKKLGVEVKKEKEYLADLKLGEESVTDDEEGEKIAFNVKVKPALNDIEAVLPKFTGKIKQIPPVYSAVKIGGREAYKFARRGEKPVLLERDAEVKEIEILDYEWPHLKLRVVTGPGVYIRALARDMGKELKTGAYLSGLKRTRVGNFTEDKALSLEEFKKQWLISNNSKNWN